MVTSMIGNKIAKARKEKNISQAQLAEHLFISPQAVGKWERGESVPDIITFNRLAELLGVDLNYFSDNFSSVVQVPTSDTSSSTTDDHISGNDAQSLRWDMSSGNWADADFSGLKNLHEKFSSSNMQSCLFIGSDMSSLLLKSNNVYKCDFTSSDFSKSRIRSSNLESDIFIGCTLTDAEFVGSNVYGCDFTGADLTGVTFNSCGFEKNNLTHTRLVRTSFVKTQLVDIIFEGELDNCCFESISYTRLTFQGATITNTFFKGSNLKKMRFIDCRADRLTLAFLTNGNADVRGIGLYD